MSDTLDKVFAIIQERHQNPKPGSYTNELLDSGIDRIAQKVGEEAIEVIIAAKGQGDERVISEMADLTYHCLVLLEHLGLTPEDIKSELERRHVPDD